jgi:hypothetical protein
VFYLFAIEDVHFPIWEPYGDSSRFWIGPDPMKLTPHLTAVRHTFAEANQPIGCLLRARWLTNAAADERAVGGVFFFTRLASAVAWLLPLTAGPASGGTCAAAAGSALQLHHTTRAVLEERAV